MQSRWILIASLLIGLLFAATCSSPLSGDAPQHTDKGYTVRTIDGCQYVEVSHALSWNNGYYGLTHKGDCNNPIHRCLALPSPSAAPSEERLER